MSLAIAYLPASQQISNSQNELAIVAKSPAVKAIETIDLLIIVLPKISELTPPMRLPTPRPTKKRYLYAYSVCMISRSAILCLSFRAQIPDLISSFFSFISSGNVLLTNLSVKM